MFTKKALVALIAVAPMTAMAWGGPDARISAMGGAGVAAADYLSAPFYNPALVASNHDDSDNFGLLIPAFSASVHDSGELYDKIDEFQELDKRLKNDSLSPELLEDWRKALRSVNGSKLGLELQTGAAVAIPNKYVDLNLNSQVDIQAIAFAVIDESDLDNPLSGNLKSSAAIIGVGTWDIGLTLAKSFEIESHKFALGVTPKIQRMTGVGYKSKLDDFDSDGWDNDDLISNNTGFNLDLGGTYKINDKIELGLVGKNLVKRELQLSKLSFSAPITYKLEPEFTAGAAYRHEFFTLTSEIDLNSTSVVDGFDHETQFVKAGIEGDAWGWAQIRAGYKHDLKDSEDDLFTAGIGFRPFGKFGFDVTAAYGKDNHYGVAAQMNFTL